MDRLFAATAATLGILLAGAPLPAAGTPECPRPAFSRPPTLIPITDLNSLPEETSTSSIRLRWTAPGIDSGQLYPADGYELKWTRTMPPNSLDDRESWFQDIARGTDGGRILTGEPESPGDPDQALFSPDPPLGEEDICYFAIRYSGYSGRWSRISDPIFVVSFRDAIPPGQVVILDAGAADNGGISLSWRTAGDDGPDGSASSYEFRSATRPPAPQESVDEWWAAEGSVSGIRPAQPGALQTATIGGLQPRTRYFLAVRAADEWNNQGPISEIVSAVTSDAAIELESDDGKGICGGSAAGPGGFISTVAWIVALLPPIVRLRRPGGDSDRDEVS